MAPTDPEPAKAKPAPSAKRLQSPERKRKIPPLANPPQTEKKRKKTISPSADANKKPLPLEHVWTPSDEIRILEAMAAHRQAEQGKLPRTRELFDSLDGRLDSKGFGRKELRRKVRSLKRQHDDGAVKGVVPAEEHLCRLYHLSQNVWGTNPEPKVCKTFDEMRQIYPCLAHEVVHIIPDPAVLERLLMGIDDVKAHTLNAKISCLREELTQAITESAMMQKIQVPKGWQCPYNKQPPAKLRAQNHSLLCLDRLDKALGARDVAQKQLAVAQEQWARMDHELGKLKQAIIASGPPKDIRCESAESAPQSVVAENPSSHNVNQRKIPVQKKLACGNNKEVTSKYRPPKNLSGKVILAPKRMHVARKEKMDAESQILHHADDRKVAGRGHQDLSHHMNVEGGERVILISCVRPHRPVAKATVQTCLPSTMVGGKALGPGCCQVLVNEVLDGKALLIRPFGTMNTMADALGHSIAWIRAKTQHDTTAGMVASNQASPGHG
ncbi:uncharacterized protein LOC124666847 [Lolium rigidum]|uniref:uncharacterized protein LOC124666847 n=1 Tax=Lolium rigidum TaxID=89674 RepID=UPI001F5D041C|nr:uncharacterized protein LOC124666847 [Lolium rigidum]